MDILGNLTEDDEAYLEHCASDVEELDERFLRFDRMTAIDEMKDRRAYAAPRLKQPQE